MPDCCLVVKDESAVLGLVRTGEAGVHPGNVDKTPFSASENQRKTIIRSGTVQSRHTACPEQVKEFRDTIFPQHVDCRDVQRSGESFSGMDSAGELTVEILRREAVDIDRDIRQQSARKHLALLKQGAV